MTESEIRVFSPEVCNEMEATVEISSSFAAQSLQAAIR